MEVLALKMLKVDYHSVVGSGNYWVTIVAQSQFVLIIFFIFLSMVRDLMTNCRHLILFLVVQKILASLKLTTVFTVTLNAFHKTPLKRSSNYNQA